MMIKTLSLKQKILLSVVIALSLVIMLLSWQSYSAQKTLLIQESQDQARQLGQQEAKRISDWLLVRQDIIQALSNKASTEPLNALQQAQVSGRFQLTYFGENNGAMHDSDPGVNRTGYDPRSRGWYQDAMRQQGAVVTKPYLDVAYNVMVVTLAQPTQGGVVGGDLSIASLIDSVINMTLPAQGFAIMTHKEGNVIAYKNAEKAMQLATEIDSKLTRATINQSKSSDHLIPVYFDSEDRNKLLLTVDIPQTEWELLLVLDKAALEAPLSALLIRQLGLTMLVLIGSTLLISWLLNTLLGPLVKVSQALARIADGNGDLTQRIDVDSRDEVGQLANCFNRFVGSQHQLISNIRQLANELNADAERSLVLNQAAVEELQRQQQEVTLVATAVTEMASATMEIAGNAEQTAAAAQQSAHSSEQGKMRVNKTLHSVKGLASEVGQATEVIGELSRYAQAITSILSTIQGIAEQTNLLAL
ncbi:MAG: methyl-accepting chemotaxis protein, partial [Plesiomonas sp.]